AGRASVLEAFARDTQDVAEKGGAFAFAQRLSERHAIGDASAGRPPHRVQDEISAAELEEGPMTVLAMRGSDEEFDRLGLGHQRLQRLARLVPVDQEDYARAEEGKKTIEIGLVAPVIHAMEQIERLALGEVAILILRERAPLDCLISEQRHEEFRADAVDVSVSCRDGEALDMHDEHMRVGRANVILDGEPRANTAGGRFEPRMPESKPR